MVENPELVRDVLRRTPPTLRALVAGLPPALERGSEGPGTWSPFDVVGHLIHGERTDWIGRARTILEHGERREFEPFDRFAMLADSRGKTLAVLLDEFETLRRANLETLAGFSLSTADLGKTGRHPELGVVTLGQLLSTWAAHDLGHVAQISRVMAKRFAPDVGPWVAYLPVLHPRPGTPG